MGYGEDETCKKKYRFLQDYLPLLFWR